MVPFEIYDHKIRLDCKIGHLNLFPINEYKDYQKSNTSKIDIKQNNNRKNECISCESELKNAKLIYVWNAQKLIIIII